MVIHKPLLEGSAGMVELDPKAAMPWVVKICARAKMVEEEWTMKSSGGASHHLVVPLLEIGFRVVLGGVAAHGQPHIESRQPPPLL
jgi:hypothetical protein